MPVTRDHANKKTKEDIIVCNIQRFLKERKNIVVVIERVKAHGGFWHRVRIRGSCIWDPVHRTGGVLEESGLLDDRPNHWETG